MRLPKTVKVNFSDLDSYATISELYDMDEDDIADIISDYLSDTFGFCHGGFDMDINYENKLIIAHNILWDRT